jgi:hypothetical protein
MTHSQKTFQYINTLLAQLAKKGYHAWGHTLEGEVYLEYSVSFAGDPTINGIITGDTSIRVVDKLIKDLEELNS